MRISLSCFITMWIFCYAFGVGSAHCKDRQDSYPRPHRLTWISKERRGVLAVRDSIWWPAGDWIKHNTHCKNWSRKSCFYGICNAFHECLSFVVIIGGRNSGLMQRCTNPKRQVGRTAKFCTVTPNTCGTLVWNFMWPFWRLEFWDVS